MKRPLQTYLMYLYLVSAIGLIIIIMGLFQVASYESVAPFFLFIGLAICAQFITSSFPISEKAGITYQVAPAVSMAVIPFFGPFAPPLIDAVSALSLWLIKPMDRKNWKKSWSQLAFNTGMGSIAALMGGLTFVAVQNALGDGLAGLLLPWLAAAIVNDQVNLWLLIGILSLQHHQEISPLEIWKENTWAVPISILLMSIGGGLLAFSFTNFGPLGVAIFFLPILLSAIAFRFYVQQKQTYMDDLEALVKKRTIALETLNKRKDAFLAILTHDMITPLTTMRLYAELIREDPTIPAEDPEFIETMLRSQKHLQRLLQNILDLERLNTGEALPIRHRHFDLTQLIKSMVEMVRVEAREKRLTIDSRVPIETALVYADQNQLERIVLNLLSNAVKYTPVNGRIELNLYHYTHQVMIEIKDTGYGIPKQEMPYIFQRFNRVRELQDKATGTGLGLAITKALVEAHGGSISVQSEEGVGSTFIIVLPVDYRQAASGKPVEMSVI